jgi:hypothetical protein
VFLSDILLPDVVTWTVEITNSNPIAVGLPHVVPPAAVGQHLAAWFGSPSIGWTRDLTTPLFDAYIFADVPEPDSIAFAALTLLMFIHRRRRYGNATTLENG